MKKNLIFFVILIVAIEMTYGQSTIQTNVRPASGTPFPFIGWNSSGTSGPLEIRNDFSQPINFVQTNYVHL